MLGEAPMESSDHDIRVLITKSTQNDAEACKQLYEHLVDKVYPFVRSRTTTNEQAIDITQDVFIDLFPSLINFVYQTRGQFYAFVFVITRRKLARHYAGVTNRKEQEVPEFDEAQLPSGNHDEAGYTDRYDLATALQQLDVDTREIVELRHWSRYSFGEIALLKEMTETAVRVRHHRALKVLADTLKEI